MLGDAGSREAAGENARLLMEKGSFAEANAAYSRLCDEYPTNRHYKTAYVRSAIEACRSLPQIGKRREELRAYVLTNIANSDDEKDRANALRFLAALGAWREGAELLLQIVSSEGSLADFDTCFRFIPRFIERGSRAALWRTIHMRLRRMRPGLESKQKAGALELDLKLLLAMERFAEFVTLFEKKRVLLAASDSLNFLEGVWGRLKKTRTDVFSEPKIFGIGLSRTGTTSLASALTILGIDTAHWANPLTHQVLADPDFFMFGASTDCSVSPEFERLCYLYPNAKFVFTSRDVDAWAQSFWKHHRRISWAGDMETFRKSFEARPFADASIQFALYSEGPDIRDSYRAFEKRVQRFFADKPKEKLLDLDISTGQGWKELCAFLGKPVPDAPFPKLNASETR